MKRYLIILALFIVCSAHAQSRRGEFNRVVNDHWNIKTDKSVAVTTWRNGTINVSDHLILIDSGATIMQVYTIIRRDSMEDFCYDDSSDHAGIQHFTAAKLTATGLKVIQGIFLYRDDKKTLTDVVFQPSAHTEITYTFNKN